MFSKWFLIPLVLSVGCASSQAELVKRRDAIRESNAAVVDGKPNFDVGAYRSSEGVRGVQWGATVDEVIAAKGQPEQRSDGALMYLDEVDGAKVPSTYFFFDGHLAEVKSRFEPEVERLERLEKALSHKWGAAEADYDKAADDADAVHTAQRWDLWTALAGISTATAAGVASRGRARVWFPVAPNAGNRQLLEHQLETSGRPARDTLWSSSDTRVHLISLSTGLTEVTWASSKLGRFLVSQQMSQAGLEDLARSL